MSDTAKTHAILEELKTEINQLLGYHDGIPRINYGPCGIFAQLFYEAWNNRFTEKVHICFVMTLSRDECDHVLIRLPSGALYDGGIGVHDDNVHLPKFIIDDMIDYDHATLEKWSYGLDRKYPRFCPNWDRKSISQIINKHLDRIKSVQMLLEK